MSHLNALFDICQLAANMGWNNSQCLFVDQLVEAIKIKIETVFCCIAEFYCQIAMGNGKHNERAIISGYDNVSTPFVLGHICQSLKGDNK